MLSLFKSCIDVPRRRRKRREVPGHGGGGNLSTLAGLPSEATTNPDHLAGPPNNAKSQTPPADPLDNAPGGPGLPAGSSAGPPAGTPSTIMIDNPSLPNGSFANASYIVMNYPMMIDGDNSNEGRSMKLLSEHIIVGAEFDSSDHHPSCHPDTRLDISHSIQSWMYNLARKYKILWLHGPAGVGKSAILQTIAEVASKPASSILGATLFFSRPNNRDDPKCVFITIAYRLAVRYPLYRQYVARLLAIDPQLVERSLAVQFETFIVQPFAVKQLLAGHHDTVLILLDGLDECKGEEAQREIILLIGKFVLQHPTSPLIWLIASRPEPHIQNMFASRTLRLGYEEIQVLVDSVQGRRDVEKYLRESFVDIRERYPQSIPSSLQQWPSESDFSTIATRSSGLFIFPTVLIRFIGDTAYADPDSRLKMVLEVIESTSSSDGAHNPFKTLDALYTRILSEVPRDVLLTTLTLIAMYAAEFHLAHFNGSCNWLGITQSRAYGAFQRLHSVLDIPGPQNTLTHLKAFHASFYECLLSPSRSGSFYVLAPEIIQHLLLRCIRILFESHSVETSEVDLTRVSSSWPNGSELLQQYIQLRIFGRSLDYIIRVSDEFVNDSIQNEFSRLAAFFQDLDFGEALGYTVLDMLMYPKSVFANNLKHWGVLKTVPLQSFNLNDIRFDLRLQIYQYKERGTEVQIGWPTGRQRDAVPAFQRIFREAVTMNSQGEPIKDFRLINVSNEPIWKADLEKNLAIWKDMIPSHPIVMLGRGRKSCACFQFHVPGELWALYLPCVQSV